MLASVMQMQLLPAVLALAAFLVAILLTLYIVRMLFGRRIRVSGGRNRPKRLDIVDAFDLDRERQLVIVRRDNVEHLLLIGGPSDVLIEAGFERGPAAAQAETKPEGREPRLPAAGGTPSWPSPPEDEEEAAETPLVAREPVPRFPSPPPAIGSREAPPSAAPIGADGLRRRFPEPPRPAPPRPPEPPRAPGGAPPAPSVRPPAPPPGRMGPPPPRGPEPQQWEPPAVPTPGSRPDAPPPPSRPAAPGLGQRPAAPPRPAPSLAPRPPRPAAPPAPPPAENAPQEQTPSRPTRESLESLESLEAEMARLLGRPDGQ